MVRRRRKIAGRLIAAIAVCVISGWGCGADIQQQENGQQAGKAKKDEVNAEEAQESGTDENPSSTAAYKIGISMPDMSRKRWKEDVDALKEGLSGAGWEVVSYDAEGDIEKQRTNISALVREKADLLIVGALDGDGLSEALNEAAEQSVPVIAYDRLLMNTDAVDYYVSFDHYAVGKAQAEYVIEQLGLTESLLENNTGQSYTMRMLNGDLQHLENLFMYQGMEDVLIPYMWEDTAVLKLVGEEEQSADVRLEQLWEETDDHRADKYVIGLIAANGACKGNADKDLLLYENSALEAEVTCLLVKELLEKGTVTADFLDSLDYECRFDKHSYDNGTGIIPAFLIEAEKIPAD